MEADAVEEIRSKVADMLRQAKREATKSPTKNNWLIVEWLTHAEADLWSTWAALES